MSSEKTFDLSSSLKLSAGIVVGILFGAMLGCFQLIASPVKEVTEIPDKMDPAVHYVLKGRTAGGDSWKFKANEFQDRKGEVTFLETEMNRWASTFKTEYPEDKPTIYLEPQSPIFRLEGDQLMVSAKADTAFGAWKKLVTLSLEGDFVPEGDSLYVIPDKLYIGSLRLPGPVKNYVWNEISSAYILNDEFQSLWSSIESANIIESQLILTAKE